MYIEDYHINRLKKYIKENINIEHFLKSEKKNYINFLIKNKNIRGIRQHFGLPVRGQRTHSNAKTSKKIKIFYEKKRNNFI
jgi:ribosomal protein S13